MEDDDEIGVAMCAAEERAQRALGFFPAPQWAKDVIAVVGELRRMRRALNVVVTTNRGASAPEIR